MAIDDNTLYGLTGAQIKELPERIEAVKGLARELTTEDYNWPVSNPTSVALWLLEPGTYCKNDANIVVRYGTTSASGGSESLVTFIVDKNNTVAHTLAYRATSSGSMFLKSVVTDVASGAVLREFNLNEVNNTLTSTSVEQPLSANQGKVLNDKIGGDLSNLTTTDKTSLINAINEVAAGGGGPTVVQTTGTSTTDVMSQNAVTSMVFADPSTNANVNIGGTNLGSRSVAIGYNTNISASYPYSVALGAGAKPSARGEVNIGSGTQPTWGYNNTAYRLLTGLYDPQSDHDAATKSYVDTAVAGAGAATFTTNEWNALWA